MFHVGVFRAKKLKKLKFQSTDWCSTKGGVPSNDEKVVKQFFINTALISFPGKFYTLMSVTTWLCFCSSTQFTRKKMRTTNFSSSDGTPPLVEHQSVDWNLSFFIFVLGTFHRGTQSVDNFLPIYSKPDNDTIAEFLRSASCQVSWKAHGYLANVRGEGSKELRNIQSYSYFISVEVMAVEH